MSCALFSFSMQSKQALFVARPDCFLPFLSPLCTPRGLPAPRTEAFTASPLDPRNHISPAVRAVYC